MRTVAPFAWTPVATALISISLRLMTAPPPTCTEPMSTFVDLSAVEAPLGVRKAFGLFEAPACAAWAEMLDAAALTLTLEPSSRGAAADPASDAPAAIVMTAHKSGLIKV